MRWRTDGSGPGCRGSVAHQDAIDTIPVHVHDLESVATSFEDIAGPRHTAQSRHGKTSERVIVLVLFVTEQRLDIDGSQDDVEVQPAIHEPATVVATDDQWFLAWLTGQVADNGRRHIRQADQTLRIAKFVDDQRDW